MTLVKSFLTSLDKKLLNSLLDQNIELDLQFLFEDGQMFLFEDGQDFLFEN